MTSYFVHFLEFCCYTKEPYKIRSYSTFFIFFWLSFCFTLIRENTKHEKYIGSKEVQRYMFFPDSPFSCHVTAADIKFVVGIFSHQCTNDNVKTAVDFFLLTERSLMFRRPANEYIHRRLL